MKIFDWLLKGFRRSAPKTAARTVPESHVAPPTAETPIPPEATHTPAQPPVQAPAVQANGPSGMRRAAFWAEIGTIAPEPIVPAGAAGWPDGPESYRITRRENGNVVVATDGLSDPFPGEEGTNGLEYELFLETPDFAEQAPDAQSWAVALMRHVAAIVTEAGVTGADFDAYGALPLELPGVSRNPPLMALPEHFVGADDTLGVILGAPAPDFATRIEDMPHSPVRLVPVVLLTASELAELRAGDETTCFALVDALTAKGHRNLSSAARAPLF